MQKVLVYVSQHPSAGSEIVERPFETFWIGSTLGCCKGGMCRGDLKQNRGFLVRDGSLGDQLVREGISPRKVDSDFGKAQL
jgi:hypothetical protein